MDAVTLVIAIVGLVVSAVSLTWQVVQHALTGARVQVELQWGALRGSELVSGPFAVSIDRMASQGFTDGVITITARNRGRLAVDVRNFEVKTKAGTAFSYPGWQLNPTVPHRLEPGSEVTFMIPKDYIDRLTTIGGAQSDHGIVAGAVSLGTGERRLSDWTVYPVPGA